MSHRCWAHYWMGHGPSKPFLSLSYFKQLIRVIITSKTHSPTNILLIHIFPSFKEKEWLRLRCPCWFQGLPCDNYICERLLTESSGASDEIQSSGWKNIFHLIKTSKGWSLQTIFIGMAQIVPFFFFEVCFYKISLISWNWMWLLCHKSHKGVS